MSKVSSDSSVVSSVVVTPNNGSTGDIVKKKVSKTVSTCSNEVSLENEWTFYFDAGPPSGLKAAEWVSYVKNVGSFSTIQGFWRHWNHLMDVSKLAPKSNLRIFKSRILPTWEDKANVDGGKFIFRLPLDVTSSIWFEIVLALIGEQLACADELCGAVLSIRAKETRLNVWHRSCHDPAMIAQIQKELMMLLGMKSSKRVEYQPHRDRLDSHQLALQATMHLKAAGTPKNRNIIQQRAHHRRGHSDSFTLIEPMLPRSPKIARTAVKPALGPTKSTKPPISPSLKPLNAPTIRNHRKCASFAGVVLPSSTSPVQSPLSLNKSHDEDSSTDPIGSWYENESPLRSNTNTTSVLDTSTSAPNIGSSPRSSFAVINSSACDSPHSGPTPKVTRLDLDSHEAFTTLIFGSLPVEVPVRVNGGHRKAISVTSWSSETSSAKLDTNRSTIDSTHSPVLWMDGDVLEESVAEHTEKSSISPPHIIISKPASKGNDWVTVKGKAGSVGGHESTGEVKVLEKRARRRQRKVAALATQQSQKSSGSASAGNSVSDDSHGMSNSASDGSDTHSLGSSTGSDLVGIEENEVKKEKERVEEKEQKEKVEEKEEKEQKTEIKMEKEEKQTTMTTGEIVNSSSLVSRVDITVLILVLSVCVAFSSSLVWLLLYHSL